MAVLLGIIKSDVNTSNSHWSYSKIGGHMDMLPIKHEKDTLQVCSLCQRKMAFLSQIYCPIPGSTTHRNLYVFCCLNFECNKTENGWRVLRSCFAEPSSVIPQKEEESWVDGEDDWENDESSSCFDMDDFPSIDDLQEKLTLDSESSDVAQPPESVEIAEPEDDDNFDQDFGGIVVPETQVVNPEIPSLLENERTKIDFKEDFQPIFRSYFIEVIEEPLEVDHKDLHVTNLIKKYEQKEGNSFYRLNENKSSVGKESYEKQEVKHGDHFFHKFISRASKCPNQVIRYSWGGNALHMQNPKAINEPSACKRCGSKRIFEMQLMPPLIQHLKLENFMAEGTLLEFGTVVIYSCSKNCWQDDDVLVEELIVIEKEPEMY